MWACLLSRESCASSPLTSCHYFPPTSSVIFTRQWVIHATEEAVDGTCESEGAYSREGGVSIPTSVSSTPTLIIMSLHEKTSTPTCDRERAHDAVCCSMLQCVEECWLHHSFLHSVTFPPPLTSSSSSPAYSSSSYPVAPNSRSTVMTACLFLKIPFWVVQFRPLALSRGVALNCSK